MKPLLKTALTRTHASLEPGKQKTATLLVPLGIFLRILVAFALVSGLYLFTENAFGMECNRPLMLGVIFGMLTLAALMSYFRIAAVIGGILCAGGVGFAVWYTAPATVIDLAVSFFNRAVSYMMTIGYYTLYVFRVESPYTDEQQIEMARFFFLLLTAAVALIVGFSSARKIRVLPLALVVGIDFFVIFMYNISTSKWGFALALAGIGGLLCLKAAERMTYPAYAKPEKEKKNKEKKDKTEKKAEKAPKLTAEEKQTLRAQARAENKTAIRGYAMTGFCGFACALLIFAAAAIPAAKVKESWKSYKTIENVMEVIRSYETAIITGEDMQISDLGLTGAAEILKARSALATPRSFTGKEVLEVQTNVNIPVYLRSWVSTTFLDDEWYVADEETRDAFKTTFSSDFRAESVTETFYQALGKGYTKYNQKTSYSNYEENGYITSIVSVKNVGATGNILFLPSRYSALKSLLSYGTLDTAYEKKWVNYFDGIAYSRAFHRGAQYTTVGYLPIYKDEDWMQTLNAELYAYSLYKAACGYDQTFLYDDYRVSAQAVTMLTQFNELTAEEQETMRENIRLSEQYESFVYDSGLYSSLTEDDALNDRLTDLACEIIMAEPLPLTGVIIPYTDGETETTEMDYTEAMYHAFHNYIRIQTDENGNSVPETVSYIHREEITDAATGEITGYTYYIDDSAFVSYLVNTGYYSTHFAKCIAKYLSENMTYTLTPTIPDTEDDDTSAVERFLFETHEGYCVQYATAATLLLRSVGVPTRYVEGYIAPKFSRNKAEDKVGNYICHVRDYNAHAWCEIYVSGYGWLTTEVTTPYYSEMYDPYESISYSYTERETTGLSTTPETPVEEEPEEPDTFWDIYGSLIIALLITAAVLGVCIVIVVKYLRVQSDRRYRRKERIMNGRRGLIDDDKRAETVSLMYDDMLALVRAFGLKPQSGETPAFFMKRVDLRFSLSAYSAVETLSLFEKNEFGDVPPTDEEIAAVAGYMLALEDKINGEIGFFRRFCLVYLRGLLCE